MVISIVDQAAHDYDMAYCDVEKIWLANEDELDAFYQALKDFVMTRANAHSYNEDKGALDHLDIPTTDIEIWWAHPQNSDKIKLILIKVLADKYLCIDVVSEEGIIPEDKLVGRLVIIPDLTVIKADESDYDITTCPIYNDFLFQYFIASMKTEQVELSCNVYKED